MTAHLPPSLLALFAPRAPISFIPPMEKDRLPSYSGIGEFVSSFEPQEKEEQSSFPFDTKKQRKLRQARNKIKKHRESTQELEKEWDPSKDSKATVDPYKTLFVGRLSYDTSEHKLKREFELYGPIKKVRVIADKEGKSRGYGFVEYEKERDMKSAYKQADGKKVDNRRIVVDVERGRTVRGWKPRRLGGGLGFTRAGPENANQRFSGREPPAREDYPGGVPTDDRNEPKERSRSRERDRERDKDRDKDRKRHRERSRERDRRERHH